MVQFNFEAIGTKWQIDIYQEISEDAQNSVLKKIQERIGLFDKAYSRFRGDSLVTKISKASGVYVLPDDAEPMMALYYDLYKRTNGLVTPLIGNLISDAGYDAKYSLKQRSELRAPLPWEAVLEFNAPNLVVKKPVMLDFGAAGKGYLIDLVAEVLEKESITQYCIDAGGDILYKNIAPIRVGLENPDNIQQVVGVCTLANGSICGSAGNRRAWGEFTHIINPKTQSSPKDILAVWVTAKSAMLADALATCLFFVSPDTLSSAYEFDYVIIRSNHTAEKSAGFSGELFFQQ